MAYSNCDPAVVIAVCASAKHTFSKQRCGSINLLAGLGVEGDAHLGATVKHRSRVAADPSQPNLRQVHLVHEELLEELSKQGFQVEPGSIGENITTRGVDLLGLPHGARLLIGDEAVVEITGLRNPCKQLDDHQPGLLKAVLDRDENGALVRKAGIMGVVITGGIVKAGDEIDVLLPDPPFAKLDTV